MSQNNQFTVTGRVFWAHVRKPNDLSGKYQLDLSIDDATAKKIKDAGITPKKEEKNLGTENDRGTYVTLTRSATNKEGMPMPPPVLDGKKNPVPDNIMIGNGSVVNVVTHVYDWTFKNKKGKSLGLDAIQIKSLVEYNNPVMDLLPEDDGYVVNSVNLDVEDFNFDD